MRAGPPPEPIPPTRTISTTTAGLARTTTSPGPHRHPACSAPGLDPLTPDSEVDRAQISHGSGPTGTISPNAHPGAVWHPGGRPERHGDAGPAQRRVTHPPVSALRALQSSPPRSLSHLESSIAGRSWPGTYPRADHASMTDGSRRGNRRRGRGITPARQRVAPVAQPYPLPRLMRVTTLVTLAVRFRRRSLEHRRISLQKEYRQIEIDHESGSRIRADARRLRVGIPPPNRHGWAMGSGQDVSTRCPIVSA